MYDTLYGLHRAGRTLLQWWLRMRKHRLIIALDSETGQRILMTESRNWVSLNQVTYVARRVTIREEVMAWCESEGITPCIMGTNRDRDNSKLSIFFETKDEAFAFKMRWL